MALVLIIATFILVTYESCIVDIQSPPKLWDSLPTRKLETHLFWAMILRGVSPSGFYIPPPLLPGNYCTDPNEPKNARNLSSRACILVVICPMGTGLQTFIW